MAVVIWDRFVWFSWSQIRKEEEKKKKKKQDRKGNERRGRKKSDCAFFSFIQRESDIVWQRGEDEVMPDSDTETNRHSEENKG